jgi:hypothetical protein
MSASEALAPNTTPASRWRWYVNRLRCMSFFEVLHRVDRRIGIEWEKRTHGWFVRVPEADLTLAGASWLSRPEIADPAPYLQAADRLVAGRFDIFSLRNIDLGAPPRWNRDCKTGIEAPLQFAKLLDYRDPQLVGDIKYLWEPNRHQHLVTLAQAWRLSGKAIYADTIRQHVLSWIADCPEGLGANWSSSLEAGLRLISWSLTWQLLGGADSPVFAGSQGEAFREAWLEAIYRQQRFIDGFFSRYSSANNHLIGEASGLFVAALTWPHWSASRRWARRSRAILEREILLQNAPDGVNREQAVAYQHFELDLLLVALLAGQAAQYRLAQACQCRIEAMLDYLAAIIDAGGNLPMFGDSDDAVAVRLAVEDDFCPYRSLLASGAVLFQRGSFKALAGKLDDKTRWLLGRQADVVWQQLPSQPGPPLKRAFPEGGYYILGSDFGTPREIRLTADAGPLGYPRIAAHGHADALSFTLSIGGYEFLIDPGTYAYHTESVWRAYFRGTSAHNTLCVDGLDQSESGGNFMWLRPARVICSGWQSDDQADIFAACHDGYQRLPDPVRHTRRILYEKNRRHIVIDDHLKMAGDHDIELFFHGDERCAVERIGDHFVFCRDGHVLEIQLPDIPGASATVYRASLNPIAGWVSRRFDEKCAAPTLCWRARLRGDTLLRSVLNINGVAGF